VDDLKEAWDRMNQNASNSSRPPGSEAPWVSSSTDTADDLTENEAEADDTPADETESGPDGKGESSDTDTTDTTDSDETPAPPTDKRPAGRQPGSSGFGRTQRLAVTGTLDHYCEQCFGCGQTFEVAGQTAYTGFYSIDLEFGEPESPGLRLTNTLHRYYQQTCPHCHLVNQREPMHHPPEPVCWDKVELSEWRLVGPGLAALIAYLCMDMRVSRRKVEVFLYDLLGRLRMKSFMTC